jgi:carbon storage regulator CsrA|tara:strand:+ start:494 stop:691 length:198 start_codon:yes stop_codon:yes gene_type:complete
MLKLERKVNESIFIGKDHEIEVRVLGFQSAGKVSLGFFAPDSIPIYRSELIREDNANEYFKRAAS